MQLDCCLGTRSFGQCWCPRSSSHGWLHAFRGAQERAWEGLGPFLPTNCWARAPALCPLCLHPCPSPPLPNEAAGPGGGGKWRAERGVRRPGSESASSCASFLNTRPEDFAAPRFGRGHCGPAAPASPLASPAPPFPCPLPLLRPQSCPGPLSRPPTFPIPGSIPTPFSRPLPPPRPPSLVPFAACPLAPGRGSLP